MSAAFVLVYFVKPLVLKWMEINRDVVTVRRLAREYERHGCEPSVAMEKAAERVFAPQSNLAVMPQEKDPPAGAYAADPEIGIVSLFAELFRGRSVPPRG